MGLPGLLRDKKRHNLQATSGVQGDTIQQGGTFLIRPERNPATPPAIVFAHINQHTGDHAKPDAVLEAVKRHFGAGSS
jgi:hypothetical protein